MSGVLLNLILAPLLILYFQLGITGAAVATLTSQCFGCAMLFWMTHKGENIRIRLSNFTPTRALPRRLSSAEPLRCQDRDWEVSLR